MAVFRKTRTQSKQEQQQRTPLAGDIVRDADGSLALVSRIGWHDQSSPYYAEEGKVWRAYIIGLNTDGSIWTDWALYEELTVAEAEGVARFCEAVRSSRNQHMFYVTIENAEAPAFASAS